MSRRVACRAGWMAAVAVWALTGCVQILTVEPPARPFEAAPARLTDGITTKHRALALDNEQAGDFAAAVTEWHILSLLAPDDDGVRRRLAAARKAAERASQAQYEAGVTALRAGDPQRAKVALLRALHFDPRRDDAADMLRRIEEKRLSKLQADHITRLTPPAAARATPPLGERKDVSALEDGLDLLAAGDVAGGMRELRRYVETHPADKAGRQRIGAALQQHARLLEGEGTPEQALVFYEQAAGLSDEVRPAWTARIGALRRQLADAYYEKGVRAYRSDLAQALQYWETSLRYQPDHLKARVRLNQALRLQQKLDQLGPAKEK